MPFLAKGSDKALKSAAENEMSQPSKAAEQLALAEAWQQIAGQYKDAQKKSLLRMATFTGMLYSAMVASS